KAKAIAVHAQAPDDEVFSCGCLRNDVTIGFHLEKLAAACHAVKTIMEILALVAMNAKLTNQLLESGCVLGLAFDFLQNSGVRKHCAKARLSKSQPQSSQRSRRECGTHELRSSRLIFLR